MTSQVHPSSYISDKVNLAKNVKIGPYCYLDGNINIGENTELKSHVVISGNTHIGKNNIFYPFSNIGCDPQDLKYNGEESSLLIGDDNIFRENITISKGTKDGGMSGIDKNVLPFSLVIGNRAKLRGLNLVGIRRNSFDKSEIKRINTIHDEFINGIDLDNKNKIDSIFIEFNKIFHQKLGHIQK